MGWGGGGEAASVAQGLGEGSRGAHALCPLCSPSTASPLCCCICAPPATLPSADCRARQPLPPGHLCPAAAPPTDLRGSVATDTTCSKLLLHVPAAARPPGPIPSMGVAPGDSRGSVGMPQGVPPATPSSVGPPGVEALPQPRLVPSPGDSTFHCESAGPTLRTRPAGVATSAAPGLLRRSIACLEREEGGRERRGEWHACPNLGSAAVAVSGTRVAAPGGSAAPGGARSCYVSLCPAAWLPRRGQVGRLTPPSWHQYAAGSSSAASIASPPHLQAARARRAQRLQLSNDYTRLESGSQALGGPRAGALERPPAVSHLPQLATRTNAGHRLSIQ